MDLFNIFDNVNFNPLRRGRDEQLLDWQSRPPRAT